MNTHDIELPPLPSGYPTYEFPDGAYDSEQMHQYALAAIEADRKQQGEVVVTKDEAGYIVAVTRQDKEGRILSVIAEADRKRRGEPVAWYTEDHLTDKSATTYDPAVAERWLAKRWPVTPLYATPQPAEPCGAQKLHNDACGAQNENQDQQEN